MRPAGTSASEQIASNAFIHAESDFACILYAKGHFYLGQVNAQLKRQGIGLLFFPRFGFFFGHFKADLAEGFGCLKEPNGNQTLGQFSSGVLHGRAVKYRVFSKTVRTEIYEHSFLRKIEDNRVRVLSSSTDSEVRMIDELFGEFLAQIKGLNTITVSTSEQGLYLGAARAGSPCGVGVLFKSNCEVDLGFFDQGRLNGPGQRLQGEKPTGFSIFRSGVVLRPLGQTLDMREARTVVPEAENRPDFVLLEDAVFFESAQVAFKQRKYLQCSVWFDHRLVENGFEIWSKVFFCPLSFEGAIIANLKIKQSQNMFGRFNEKNSHLHESSSMLIPIRSSSSFTERPMKETRMLTDINEQIRDQTILSLAMNAEESRQLRSFDEVPTLPSDQQKAMSKSRKNTLPKQTLINEFSQKTKKFGGSETVNPVLMNLPQRTSRCPLLGMNESEFTRDQKVYSSIRTQEDVPRRESLAPNQVKRPPQTQSNILLELLEKGKLSRQKHREEGQREQRESRLRNFKSFDHPEPTVGDRKTRGGLLKREQNMTVLSKNPLPYPRIQNILKK